MAMRRRLVAVVTTGLMALAGGADAQVTAAGAAVLRLSAQRDTILSAADFARLPRSTIRVPAAHRHGADSAPPTTTTYGGVALADLLALVGAPRDAALRGRTVSLYLLIEASDGYRVVFSLDELAREGADPVILADRRDDQPLPADEGPWRVIAPGARHSRWIRQVARLSVREAAP
jgi:DMSO/TMAO reductase YedYZ molybdopterin-dependent catalytic subunit